MCALKRDQFRFKKHERIGTEGAEEDQDFLYECFVDTGDIETLRDVTHPARIVVGRTGVGKTALLMTLERLEENVSVVDPDQLSLQYISNSNIISWLNDNNVKLDLFYKLLWRHVFAIELIKLKYDIKNEQDQKSFMERMYTRFLGDQKKKDALNYLIDWGKHFWEDTEYRIHEVTQTLEEGIRAKIGAMLPVFNASLSGERKITKEEKYEIVHRAQSVVNSVQIKKLSEIIDILAQDIFDDNKQKFFVLIDKLDEQWIDDEIKSRLIRALIETVRDLKKITSAKIVISLRMDLLDRVFRETRDSGYQEEKYQPLYLRLSWSKKELTEVVNKRINKLVHKQYAKEAVVWQDIFVRNIKDYSTIDYLIDRTFFRPRDIINYINCCIELATDRPEITATMVRTAESDYSKIRFRSLGDEWANDYPGLLSYAQLLRGRSLRFNVTDVPEVDIEELLLDVITKEPEKTVGPLGALGNKVYEGTVSLAEFRLCLIRIFYKVGLVGIRLDGQGVNWSFMGRGMLRDIEIDEDSRIEICPMFYRVLGVKAVR